LEPIIIEGHYGKKKNTKNIRYPWTRKINNNIKVFLTQEKETQI
jgi:hypothetical protein